MAMIDWITGTIPFEWHEPINAGRIETFHADGSMGVTKEKWLQVDGELGAKVQILSSRNKEGAKVLHFSGNPSKFLQGHNLFGIGDLIPLNTACFCKIADSLGHKPSSREYHSWTQGDYSLSRVDVNAMYSCGSRAAVRELCHTIVAPRLELRRVGGGIDCCTTVYLQERSRRRRNPHARKQAPRWVGRIYGKADELGIRNLPRNPDDWEALKDKSWGGDLPQDIIFRDKLCAWVDDKVRVERQLNRKFLHEHGLNRASAWRVPGQPQDYQAQLLLDDMLLKVRIFKGAILDADLVASLPQKLLAPFLLWRKGEDLRQFYSSATIKRYRNQFLDLLNLDILEKPNYE
jgi:II/X family phage/plasmid replication protein